MGLEIMEACLRCVGLVEREQNMVEIYGFIVFLLSLDWVQTHWFIDFHIVDSPFISRGQKLNPVISKHYAQITVI